MKILHSLVLFFIDIVNVTVRRLCQDIMLIIFSEPLTRWRHLCPARVLRYEIQRNKTVYYRSVYICVSRGIFSLTGFYRCLH